MWRAPSPLPGLVFQVSKFILARADVAGRPHAVNRI